MGLKKDAKKVIKSLIVFKNKLKLCKFLKRNNIFFQNIEYKIGFFTPLPPAPTGTGLYAIKTYSSLLEELDFVSEIYTQDNYIKTLGCVDIKYNNHIVPLFFFEKMKRNYKYSILNLGNSGFHVPYLEYGIKTKGLPQRYISLCETQICGLLVSWCQKNHINFIDMIQKYYPEKHDIQENDLYSDFLGTLQKEYICGIRVLVGLTGIKHFIVYRKTGRDLLLKDLKGSCFEKEVKVSLLPMGFDEISPLPQKIIFENKAYNVGSFGIASDMKQTDKIINAVNLLNLQGNKVVLWLVGLSVKDYVSKFDLTNVRIIENASYDKLLSYMYSMDLSVQLRKFSIGEGSGCISELVTLNKNFIAAENLFEPYYKKAGVSVPTDCSVKELASIIWRELQAQTARNNRDILKKYTFKKTAQSLKSILK